MLEKVREKYLKSPWFFFLVNLWEPWLFVSVCTVLYQSIESQLLVHCQLKTGSMLLSLFLDRCGWDLVSD